MHIGVLIISKIGGVLFENVSIYAPFVFVGICDVLFILLVLGLRTFGKFNK
jgi:hypothetical protein